MPEISRYAACWLAPVEARLLFAEIFSELGVSVALRSNLASIPRLCTLAWLKLKFCRCCIGSSSPSIIIFRSCSLLSLRASLTSDTFCLTISSRSGASYSKAVSLMSSYQDFMLMPFSG